MKYLLSDLLCITILFYLSTYISSPLLPPYAKYILWPIYWYVQGSIFTGVWVLAHECGHQSFSESELANNIIGTICHSLLLVPYHSWRITHSKHHSNTGSCTNDEVFCPSTRHDWKTEMLRETPISQAIGIIIMLTVGWPGYLLFNVTGPVKYREKSHSHFNPWAVFFREEDFFLIIQSDIAFFTVLGGLIYSFYTYGN
jgi:omega-6 fatty acid desaturase (delta-12 desaturase)